MPLATDIQKDHYAPVKLFEFDIFQYLTFSTTKEAFIWQARFDNLYPWICAALLSGAYQLASVSAIGSVKTENDFLIPTSSYAECVANRISFFWDADDGLGVLYLHMPRGDNPALFPALIGEIHGVRMGGTKDLYDNVYYPADLLSIPSMSRSKSDYFTAKSANEGGAVKLNNAKNQYDAIVKDKTIIGNAARTYLGMENYNKSSFQLIYTGYIRSVDAGVRDIIFDVKQNNDKLKVPIPKNRYELSRYPYLNESNDGKVIPYVYGIKRDYPVTCLNEMEFTYDATTRPSPAEELVFQVTDTEFHPNGINNIYNICVYVDDQKISVSSIWTDYYTSKFALSSDDYVPGQKVTVDVEGYLDAFGALIENDFDIIKDLIVNHTRANFNALYFNTLKWDDTLAHKGSPEIDKETTVEDVIKDCAQNSLAHFQIDNDGRYSCKIFDPAAAVDLILHDYEILSGEIRIKYDQLKLVSELVVKYDKNFNDETYRTYTNSACKKDNNNLYETYIQKIIETIMYDAVDAADFATRFLEIFGVPYITCEVETPLVSVLQEISNIVQMEFKRPLAPDIGTWKNEIVSITNDFNTNRVKLGLRLFQEVV